MFSPESTLIRVQNRIRLFTFIRSGILGSWFSTLNNDQCYGSGYGFGCLWVWSGWVKSLDPDPREQPGSYFLELIKYFFGLKYINSLLRMRVPGWKQFGSRMKKVGSGIPDKQLGSATLMLIIWYLQESLEGSTRTFSCCLREFQIKCAFGTCGVEYNTLSQLKNHLHNHHKDSKKYCVYSGCTYSTSNRHTLRVRVRDMQ